MHITQALFPSWCSSQFSKRLSEKIKDCGSLIKGYTKEKKTSYTAPEKEFFFFVSTLLTMISDALAETPAEPNAKSRYGNPGFKAFHQRLTVIALKSTLPEMDKKNLLQSFGNAVRLDYGSGHEFCFFIVLLSISEKRFGSVLHLVIFQLFWDYVVLVQQVLAKYGLEPAGSRGAWGLDDYFCLSFYLGASQLLASPDLRTPKQCFDRDLVADYQNESLYMLLLSFRSLNREGNFFQHSPFLYELCSQRTWCFLQEELFLLFSRDVLFKQSSIHHIEFPEEKVNKDN